MWKKLAFPLLFVLCTPNPSPAQSLSQNSGINPSDSHVAFDMTIQAQSTVTMSEAVYDPSTNTTTSNMTLNGNIRYRVEAGYDFNGSLVVNVFSLDPAADPATSGTDGVLTFRLAAGKLVLFDENGKPVPIVLPNGAPMPNPLQFLGMTPGSSVLNGMIVSDIQAYANTKGASIQYSYAAPGSTAPTTAYMSAAVSASGGGSTTWGYQAAGTVWTLTSVSTYSSTSSSQSSRTIQIGNLSWYGNSGSDAARASQGSTAQAAPGDSTTYPSFPQLASTTGPSTTIEPGCSASGSGQNVVFQHGLLSSCDTWTDRMFPLARSEISVRNGAHS